MTETEAVLMFPPGTRIIHVAHGRMDMRDIPATVVGVGTDKYMGTVLHVVFDNMPQRNTSIMPKWYRLYNGEGSK